MNGPDELARRRWERTQHPSTMPPVGENAAPMAPHKSYALRVNEQSSAVRARLAALENVMAEVADDLELRGVHDAAQRLPGALP